jgi:ABC-2 type transport system ATP-binding protein
MTGNIKTIEVQNLTKIFGSFTAVDNISFEVEQGHIFGFLGPNGAGKSTSIRMLNGLLLPTSGAGTVGGLDIIRQQDQIKHLIGYMSQRFSLYMDLTAEENLRFFGGVYGLPADRLRVRIAEVLELVGLQERQRERVGRLAPGLRQRLALASAIIHKPPILFLDEPTSGVDPVSRRNFWDLIYAMADQGATILVTTHYMDEAEFCDHLVLIYQGRIIAQGTPRDLKTGTLEEIVAIYPDRLAEALSIMKKLPIVTRAAMFGAGLHVVAGRAQEAEPILSQALTDQGIAIKRIQRIAPTLEDAFISLIDGTNH